MISLFIVFSFVIPVSLLRWDFRFPADAGKVSGQTHQPHPFASVGAGDGEGGVGALGCHRVEVGAGPRAEVTDGVELLQLFAHFELVEAEVAADPGGFRKFGWHRRGFR